MTGGDQPSELTAFQVEVARLFFALPESIGFLLAGGAGLLAQHLTHRPTRDLDLFTATAGDVSAARDALEKEFQVRGWTVTRIHDTDTFCRLTVTGDDALLVDLALDSPPQLPPSITFVGPTFAPEELAARKVLALFDRAEARDFADVYQLAKSFDRDLLLDRVAVLDQGFTPALLAESINSLSRFQDHEIPATPAELPGLRDFFSTWLKQLRG